MSYHYWSVDGYGICTDLIATDKNRLVNFIRKAPAFAKEIQEWITDINETWESISFETLEDYEDEYGNIGIAPIMAAVISELENIRLTVAEDFDANYYLLYEPAYPWSVLTPEERSLTEVSLSDIFVKYCKMLTDAKIKPGYESAECGG